MISSPCIYDPISGMKDLSINYFGRKMECLKEGMKGNNELVPNMERN